MRARLAAIGAAVALLLGLLFASPACAQPRAVSLLRAADDAPGLSVSFWPRRLRPGEHFAWSAPCALPCRATLDRTVYVLVMRRGQSVEVPTELEGLRGGEYVLRVEWSDPRAGPWALMGVGAATFLGGMVALLYLLADAVARETAYAAASFAAGLGGMPASPPEAEPYWSAGIVIGLGLALLVAGGIWLSETPPRAELRRVGSLPREPEEEEGTETPR